jgi:hypothetical protein
MRVPASGGLASPVTAPDESRQESGNLPVFLPDGRHFIYLRRFGAEENRGIYLSSLDAKGGRSAPRRVVATEQRAVFVPSRDGKAGELLFLREGTVLAQRFDLQRLQLTGEPVPAAEQVGSIPDLDSFRPPPTGRWCTAPPVAASFR